MERFFELEIAYIVIGIFFLVITALLPQEVLCLKVPSKKGMTGIFAIFAIMIGIHYFVTTKRMQGVKEIFNEGKTVICENKMRRTISQSVLISKKLGWQLDGDYFKNPDFIRDFHTARCVDYAPMAPKDRKQNEK